VGAVTASDVVRLAGFVLTLWAPQAGNHPIALVGEADQFGSALDEDPKSLQPLDQQALVLVLREDMQERIWREVRADTFK
jgi:hypothetical protein